MRFGASGRRRRAASVSEMRATWRGASSRNDSTTTRSSERSPWTDSSASCQLTPPTGRIRFGTFRPRLLGTQRLGDGRLQPGGTNRLGDVVVHAGRQAPFAVALQRVGRHGDDRHVTARLPFPRTDRGRGASKPSISGICTSIRIRSNGCDADGGDRLAAVADDRRPSVPVSRAAPRPASG